MRVDDFRLVGSDGRRVPFKSTPNQGGKLSGGKPRFLVIHYTAGSTASGAISWFRNRAASASAHLVIDHDGTATQMVRFDEVAWHAGKSRWRNVRGLNSHSVGIEVVNWGKLRRSATGGFTSAWGHAIPDERVVLEEHRHFPGTVHGWEIFDDAQIEATILTARAIVEAYDIKPWDLVGHDDISPLRKVDPGPAFDMDWFRARVFGRAEDEWDDILFKVRSSSGLNMRIEPTVGGTLIKNLPDNTVVHLIEKTGNWWLVAEVVNGNDDVTGYVHSHWLQPA